MHFTRRKTNYMTCYAFYMSQDELDDVLCVLYKMHNELHDMLCILQDARRTTWHVMHCTRCKTNYMTCYACYKTQNELHDVLCILQDAKRTTCHVMHFTSRKTNYMTCYALYKMHNDVHVVRFASCTRCITMLHDILCIL